jgi:predicted nuclease of restriction endonuclease-like RecB superfamily
MARKKRKKAKKKLWSKKSDYLCTDGTVVSMDSTWEVACAKKLDDLGIKWYRDPSMKIEYRTQKLRLRKYIPDFYLPDHDIYIEVKGYWTDAAKWKMKDVMQRNPGKILILDSLQMIDDITLPISPTTGSIS